MCEVKMGERVSRVNKSVTDVYGPPIAQEGKSPSQYAEILKEIFKHPYVILTSVIWMSCGIACLGTRNDSPLLAALAASVVLYLVQIGIKK